MSSQFLKNGYRSIDFTLYKKDIRQLKREWKIFSKNTPDYPTGKFKGKGIVMCAGKVGYFTCCWVSINVLRRNKCLLPIEVWYLNDELSPEIQLALAKLDVVCRNVDMYTVEKVSGWALKPFSIIHSHFREVLFLDADNICVQNPEILFSREEFKNFGAVFWPDFWKTELHNPIWDIVGCEPKDMQEQESGQLLIDKKKCWRELNLAYYFNTQKIYYYLLYGDKDTFRFAWLALKKNFYMTIQDVAICGYRDSASSNFYGVAMVQHLDSVPFFLHRNLLKWDITLPHERAWQIIKQFRPNAKKKEFIIIFKDNTQKHMYMDLQGDVEETASAFHILQLEELCIKILSSLKKSSLYRNFLDFRYIVENRFEKHSL